MKTIKNIIEESLRELKSIDCEYEIQKRNQNRKENQEQESRLIFPKTRGTKETGLIKTIIRFIILLKHQQIISIDLVRMEKKLSQKLVKVNLQVLMLHCIQKKIMDFAENI
jgi:hypothetical protein